MPRVDVVIPCYNYGRFLKASVESVLRQSVDDVRVLIIDDASSDDSVRIASEIANSDKRVTVIAHAENRGHIETYNEGIAWATSDYFLLLSADDMLVPGALERAVVIMDKNSDIVLTHGDCIVWNDGTPFPNCEYGDAGSWTRQDLITEMCVSGTNFVATPTAIARTSTQKNIGGYLPHLTHAGDMEMWLRFATKGTVARLAAVQGIYRKHAAAMSNAYWADILRDYRQRKLAFDAVFQKFDRSPAAGRQLHQMANRKLGELAFKNGITSLRRGQVAGGFQLIRWAMQMDHRLRRAPPFWQLVRIPGPEGRKWVGSRINAIGRKWNV